MNSLESELHTEEIEFVDDAKLDQIGDIFEVDFEIAHDGLDDVCGFRLPLLAIRLDEEHWENIRPEAEENEFKFLQRSTNTFLVGRERPIAISYFTMRSIPKEMAKQLFAVDRFHYYGAFVVCFNISKYGSYFNIYSPVTDDGHHCLHIDGTRLSITDKIVSNFFGESSSAFKHLVSQVDSSFCRFTRIKYPENLVMPKTPTGQLLQLNDSNLKGRFNEKN